MKPYKTNNELIDELANNKKINRETIPNGIFEERAYTSLVSPYKRLICTNYDTTNKTYIYKENGDFLEYINYARIDDYISNKFSIYIENFEKMFKAFIGEKLSEKMRSTDINCNNYSEITNMVRSLPSSDDIDAARSIRTLNLHVSCYDMLCFDEMYDKNMRIVQAPKNIIKNRIRAFKTILSLNRTQGYSSNMLIQHYFNKGVVPPIWAVTHTMSLGDILAIFNMMNRKDRLELGKIVYRKETVTFRECIVLSSNINIIRQIRNTINHYEPLVPLLIEYKNNSFEDTVFSIIELLKINYSSNTCKSIKCIRRVKYKKIMKNDFNKKNVVFINKLLKSL